MSNQRKQAILINGERVIVLSSSLAVGPDNLPYPKDCYKSEPDSQGKYQPDHKKLKGPALKLVEVARDEELNDPNAVVEYGGTTFSMSPKSRAYLMEVINLYNALGAAPLDFEWRDVDNDMHPADLEFLLDIASPL